MPWARIEESPNLQEERRLREAVGSGVIAILVAGVLAMVATWFLVAYFPIPDDDAVYVGLIVFIFVVLFDFFLIYRVAVSEIRQGQRIAAAMWAVGLFLLGLVFAAVLGSIPWLFSRLITVVPWLANSLFGGLLLLLYFANWIALRKKRRARRD